jgi:exopolyphosphatase/guanosine-5'-triphosphate,3'-diphosphate pyrophosphatase
MVIADVDAGGRIEVVDRVKEMVRLGHRAFTTGRLAPEAMQLAARTLRTFARLARARHVEQLIAVATSAVRESRNGVAFVRRLHREAGLEVRVISGIEEARLIFRAVHHALGLEGGPHLLIDVGGGSVEISLARDGRPMWLRSFPLGTARLTERFLLPDPPSAGQVRRLERHLARELRPVLDRVRRAGVARAIGTSGTVNALVSMVHAARGEDMLRLHGSAATAAEIARLRRRVLAVGPAKRADLPGMEAKRVDLMPASVALLDFILTQAGIGELVACTWALREGLLLELVRPRAARSRRAGGARRRSVEALAARFAGRNGHGRQVARLASALFDATAVLLDLPASARELLEYAALLHDIGHAIDHGNHHRHSAYLIRSTELLGFEPIEVEAIAQVVRGHRKQAPKSVDPEIAALPPRLRRTVRRLAALLRLADALDRAHFASIRNLHVTERGGRLVIEVDAGGENAELELWAAERRVDLLRRLLDRPVIVRLRASTGRARAHVPARAASRA